jgi:hypothetical protein
MQGLENSAAFWILAVLFLVVLYLLPTLVGMIRGVERLSLVFLVNLIGAPTGIGWLAAMILAFGPRPLPPVSPWVAQTDPVYGLPEAWYPGSQDAAVHGPQWYPSPAMNTRRHPS